MERGDLEGVRIVHAYDEHRYATRADLFAGGSKHHPPDSVIAGALAWWLRAQGPTYTRPDGPVGASLLVPIGGTGAVGSSPPGARWGAVEEDDPGFVDPWR